ncbi:MAG: response regulator transcription factor [Thermosipho sp. (in: Bacteria)]|nr:response regulator transcription factor [Thermosipho sp. (in: thermotogales)]
MKQFELLGDFSSVEAFQKSHAKPDVIFLDINLPGIDGIKFAKQLANTNIVFVTAFPEYGATAFEINALDYLVKPVTEERFQKTVVKILNTIPPYPFKLPVIKDNIVIFIDYNSIIYIEAQDKYAYAITLNNEYKIYKWNLNKLEQFLPKEFIRVHKSYILNSNYIFGFNKKENKLLIHGLDINIPVGKKYFKNLKDFFNI